MLLPTRTLLLLLRRILDTVETQTTNSTAHPTDHYRHLLVKLVSTFEATRVDFVRIRRREVFEFLKQCSQRLGPIGYARDTGHYLQFAERPDENRDITAVAFG